MDEISAQLLLTEKENLLKNAAEYFNQKWELHIDLVRRGFCDRAIEEFAKAIGVDELMTGLGYRRESRPGRGFYYA